MALTVACAL